MKERVDPFTAWQTIWGVSSLVLGAYVVSTGNRVGSLLELVFLLWFVGFIGGVELLVPRSDSTKRWSGIRVILLAGLVLTGLIVARRIIAIV